MRARLRAERPVAVLPQTGALRFGPFALGADGCLLRRGRGVSLPPKQAALLRLLAGSEGRVVSKQEILDSVWPGEEIGEASLTSCIHGLRSALGERGRRGRYLETVHGRGYRFAAPVARADSSVEGGRARLRVAVAPLGPRLPALSSDPRAYRALLRGSFLNQFRTETGLRQSIRCFEQALAWDPRCAAAYAALAEAYLLLGWRGYRSPREVAPAARAAVTRALELDGCHAGALAALALLRLLVDWDLAGADAALAKAEATESRYDRVPWLHANVEAARGRFDAALAALEAGLEVDPLSPNLASTRVFALWLAGRNEEALTQAAALVQAEPEFAVPHAVRAVLAATLGRRHEALRAAEAADALARGDQLARTLSAWAFARAGRPDTTRAMLGLLERRARARYVSPTLLAGIHVALEDHESALAALEHARVVRCMWFPFVGVDPRLEALRGEPRFETLRGLLESPAPEATGVASPPPEPTRSRTG